MIKKLRVVIVRSTNRQYYFKLVAKNGKIVADGGEGYYMKYNVKRAIKAFVKNITVTGYEIVDLTKR